MINSNPIEFIATWVDNVITFVNTYFFHTGVVGVSILAAVLLVKVTLFYTSDKTEHSHHNKRLGKQ